jgi:16S rRNA C1402 (ribose-2'-O) methylase RsmI
VGRELTKKFENFQRWSVKEVLEYFTKNPDKVKGEFVVLF